MQWFNRIVKESSISTNILLSKTINFHKSDRQKDESRAVIRNEWAASYAMGQLTR